MLTVSLFPLVCNGPAGPIPTLKSTPRAGFQSKELIVKAGLSLGDVDQYPVIDVTIDGADE
jgi:Ribose 5-phosphate isomerase A (phosphoriboisomerase A)